MADRNWSKFSKQKLTWMFNLFIATAKCQSDNMQKNHGEHKFF